MITFLQIYFENSWQSISGNRSAPAETACRIQWHLFWPTAYSKWPIS